MFYHSRKRIVHMRIRKRKITSAPRRYADKNEEDEATDVNGTKNR